MRRAVLLMLVGSVLLSPPAASAKFGIGKTRLTLTRFRPPDVVLLGDTVAVRVVSDSRAVTNAHLGLVRDRIEDALRAWNVVRVVEASEQADDVIEVSIDDLTARLRDSVRYEDKYVKIGERKEWDEKKNEKYFAEPIQRVEASMVYARAAADLMAERDRWAARAEPDAGADAGRGQVVELDGTAGPAAATRRIDVGVRDAATVSLDYRVVSGEAQVKVRVGYEDEAGKQRVATLEASLGEGPGGWSPWHADLGALRPRPARVTDVKVVVEGGTVRLDRLAVRER